MVSWTWQILNRERHAPKGSLRRALKMFHQAVSRRKTGAFCFANDFKGMSFKFNLHQKASQYERGDVHQEVADSTDGKTLTWWYFNLI